MMKNDEHPRPAGIVRTEGKQCPREARETVWWVLVVADVSGKSKRVDGTPLSIARSSTNIPGRYLPQAQITQFRLGTGFLIGSVYLDLRNAVFD
jgi:hypothetical protein